MELPIQKAILDRQQQRQVDDVDSSAVGEPAHHRAARPQPSSSSRAEYQQVLKDHRIVCSMSDVGHCDDNATAEGFFGKLKRERAYWRR